MLDKSRMELNMQNDLLISLKEPFDYTKWQKDLFADMSVRELSNAAMKAISEQQ